MAQPAEYFTQFKAQRLKFFVRRIRDGRTADSLKLEFHVLAGVIDEAAKIVEIDEDSPDM